MKRVMLYAEYISLQHSKVMNEIRKELSKRIGTLSEYEELFFDEVLEDHPDLLKRLNEIEALYNEGCLDTSKIVTESGDYICDAPLCMIPDDEYSRPQPVIIRVNGMGIRVHYYHSCTPCYVELLDY